VDVLQPLTVFHVALVWFFWIIGSNQSHVEAVGFEDLIEGNPVDSCRFHCDRLDLTFLEPFGYVQEIWSKDVERRNGLRAAINRDTYKHLISANVNPSSMRIYDWERGSRFRFSFAVLAMNTRMVSIHGCSARPT